VTGEGAGQNGLLGHRRVRSVAADFIAPRGFAPLLDSGTSGAGCDSRWRCAAQCPWKCSSSWPRYCPACEEDRSWVSLLRRDHPLLLNVTGGGAKQNRQELFCRPAKPATNRSHPEDLVMAIKTCAICGNEAHGKQWWNRDKGYGLCLDCAAKWIMKYDIDEFIRSYGHPGTHWGRNNPALAKYIVDRAKIAKTEPKPDFKDHPPLPQGIDPDFLHLLGINQ